MPVVYNRADSGKSSNQKPDKAPKQQKQKGGGSKAADIDADEKKKLIVLGIGTVIALVFLYWLIFMRAGGEPTPEGVNTTSPTDKAATGDGTSKVGKKGGLSLGDDPASDGGAGADKSGAKPPKSDGGM
ncbi:MAG: hypothetical protein ABJA67_11990 [Chthonomonadales bacterium]